MSIVYAALFQGQIDWEVGECQVSSFVIKSGNVAGCKYMNFTVSFNHLQCIKKRVWVVVTFFVPSRCKCDELYTSSTSSYGV